jgi:hypothetical protein
VAEGARLESVYTGNRIVGSNPTPSASPLAHPFSDRSYSSLKVPDLACQAVDLWTPKRRPGMRLLSLSHIFSGPLYSCTELRFREPLQILSLSNVLIRSIWNLTRLRADRSAFSVSL